MIIDGEIIKNIRKERNLTQKELSKKANISRTYLSDVENNRYSPSLETLNDIANALGVSIYNLIANGFDSERSDYLDSSSDDIAKDNILGKRIKLLRESSGLSQLELAKLINISNTTLSQYESGQRIPSDETKIKIAEIFDVSMDYLLGLTDNAEKHNDGDYSVPLEFTSPVEAREYINMHQIFGSQGLDVSKLNDDEVLKFANDLLSQMQMVSYKYKK